MDSQSLLALSVLLLANNVYAIAYPGPQATLIQQPEIALQGWSPKTTDPPRVHHADLSKRSLALPATCGWVSGTPLTCGAGTCMLYTSGNVEGLAGCCRSTSGRMNYQSCGWKTTCYDYNQYSQSICDANCQQNDFVRVCTNSAKPYCQSWTYDWANVQNYGCGQDSDSTWSTVSSTGSDAFGLASVSLTFAPRASVTGWKIGDVSGDGSSYTLPTDNFSGTVVPLGIVSIVIIVIIAAGWCGALGLIIYCCRRSKRLQKKWITPTQPMYSVEAAGPRPGTATTTNAPVHQPQQLGHTSTYYAPVAPQQGSYASSPELSKMNPQSPAQCVQVVSPITASGSPAPPYQQGYSNYSLSPSQPVVQPAPTHNFSYPQNQQQAQYQQPLQQHQFVVSPIYGVHEAPTQTVHEMG